MANVVSSCCDREVDWMLRVKLEVDRMERETGRRALTLVVLTYTPACETHTATARDLPKAKQCRVRTDLSEHTIRLFLARGLVSKTEAVASSMRTSMGREPIIATFPKDVQVKLEHFDDALGEASRANRECVWVAKPGSATDVMCLMISRVVGIYT
jgi:hypothetical protein